MKQKLFLVAAVALFMAAIVCSGCNGISKKSKLDAMVTSLNDSCPQLLDNYLLVRTELGKDKLTYHFYLTEPQMKQFSPGKNRERHLEHLKDNESGQRLVKALVKEKRGVTYLYTDSLSSVSISFAPDELQALLPEE